MILGRTATSQDPQPVEFTPFIDQALANGVILRDETYAPGDDTWFVPYFEGKTTRIVIRKTAAADDIPVITNISVNPTPTMTFLNPRPATGSLPYPWRYNGETVGHIIKLPLPLTYSELIEQGSEIVVSGVTDTLNVIMGEVENNLITYRADGLVVAQVIRYDGTNDLITLDIMEDFTGDILGVSFVAAFKNIPQEEGVLIGTSSTGVLVYKNGTDEIAKCLLNGVVISGSPGYMPSNGLLGNLVFQSQYLKNYGNVIEANYWTNGRNLFVIRYNDGLYLQAVQIDNTNSPLQFPLI